MRVGEQLALSRASQTVIVDSLRLAARLPEGHPVVETYEKIVAIEAASPDPDHPPSPEHVKVMQAVGDALWEAQAKFITACRTLIGSRLPD